MENKFRELNERELNSIKRYLYLDRSRSCDYTLGVKFSWANYFKCNYVIFDDTLYLKEKYLSRYAYYLPLGKNRDLDLIIGDYFATNSYPLHICNVTLEDCKVLADRFPHNDFSYDRDWSDYLYLTKDFVTFSGKKHANKRRQMNKFISLYPNVTFSEANDSDLSDIKEFIRYFAQTKNLTSEESLNEEDEAIKVINYYKDLNMSCFVLKDDKQIIGVSVVEVVNDTVFDHIEKCLRKYEGIYPYMINCLAKRFADIKYFNREDDSGDEGLRFSKTELHPIKMIDKYMFKVLNNVDLISAFPCLKLSDDISLEMIKEEDMDDYYSLSVNDDLNRYWGYDYKNDLLGQTPSPAYFYKMVLTDFLNKESFNLMIKKANKLLGEVLIYNISKENSGEIGIRLFEEYQHQGIGFIVLSAFIEYLFKDIKLDYVIMKSYKENKASISLIKKSGFVEYHSDEKFIYYKLISPNID